MERPVTATLQVRELGEGPAVLLLHAFPCDGVMWRPQAEALADDGWRVIVPDLPGFGGSPLLEGPASLVPVAQRLLEWLDGRGIDQCVLGGVSLGGYVAMAMLRARPAVASGLLLCDTKATADTEPARENRERLARLCLESPADTARILEQAVLPGLLGDTTRARRPEVVAQVRGWLREVPATTVAWYQRAMADRPDSLELLSGLGVPTLILFGSEDVLSPSAEQDLMRAAIPGSSTVEIPEAGHLANVEVPTRVVSEIRAFLADAQGTPDRRVRREGGAAL
jgi:pimeloyl-ACP methyl ester carboxylesterase